MSIHKLETIQSHLGICQLKIQFQTLWPHPDICAYPRRHGWLHLNMKLSASEETLCHENGRWCSLGFIMHSAHGRTDLGAPASKVSPAGWDLAQEDGIPHQLLVKGKTEKFCQLKFTLLNSCYSDHVTNLEVLIGLQVPGTMQTVSILSKKNQKKTKFCLSPVKYLREAGSRTAHKNSSWMALPLSRLCGIFFVEKWD